MARMSSSVQRATGPLRVHPANSRYFADASGAAVLLVGSHTWASFQERGYEGSTPDFDYPAYLDFLERYNHNFIRLWVWEHAAWAQFTGEKIRFKPSPYQRSGSEAALDGQPWFDLTRLDPAYFERLRTRVEQAGERGIYVSVMLFQGFSIERKATSRPSAKAGNPWNGHPFHRANNINGIDGDPHGEAHGRAVHTLADPRITELQEAYVRAVVDAVNDLDNVLFEVCNESHPASWPWQYHMVDFIKAYEETKPRQHPVGMTACFPHGQSNLALRRSRADWISPEHAERAPYKWDPPAADAAKVIFADTDHLWGVGGDDQWVWKSFFRGLNPIFMDPYKDVRWGDTLSDPRWNAVRHALGRVRKLAGSVDLADLEPRGQLSSSRYCLARPGSAYLAYDPGGRTRRQRLARRIRRLARLRIDLRETDRTFHLQWLDPRTGDRMEAGAVNGGAVRGFRIPFKGDAVLYLSAVAAELARASAPPLP
jgi:hypothetical protein